jgi:hypothetical protein
MAMTRKGRLYSGRSARTPSSACLECGKPLDGATGLGHRHKPRPGDISVCLYCGHLQAFDGQLRLRPLTDKEMVEIAGDPAIIAAVTVAGAARKRCFP